MPYPIMLNHIVPDFELPSTGAQPFKLSDFRGIKLVLYFYPKDATPGCTTQGMQFRDIYSKFQEANAVVFGISRDSIKSHEKFKAKFSFPFELLADTEETACRLFDVIKMKKLYGKEVRGIERSTFVIDTGGKLVREWRGLRVDGHAQEVLDFVKAL